MNGQREAGNGELIVVETDFDRLAVLPGGVSRSEAIASAESQMAVLGWNLRAEIDRHLVSLSANLDLYAHSEHNELACYVDDMLTAATGLHDLGAVAGFPAISAVASPLVRLLLSSKHGASCRPEYVGCFCDVLSLLRNETENETSPEVIDEIILALEGLLSAVERNRTQL